MLAGLLEPQPGGGYPKNCRPAAFLRLAAVPALFVGVFAVTYFYSWHVRPNIGLYREPDWVAQHPGFQQELRERISANPLALR